jgi:hypothetical protein
VTTSAPASPTPLQYAPASAARNGLGIAALCCGIVGILFGLVPLTFFVAGTLGVLGIIFGAVGLRRVKRQEASNRGMAIAGLVTGIIAFGLAIVGVGIMVSATNQLNDDLNQIQTDANASSTKFRVDQQHADHQAHLLLHQGKFIGNQ